MVELTRDRPRTDRRGPHRQTSAGWAEAGLDADAALSDHERELLGCIPPKVDCVPHVSFSARATEDRLFGRGSEGDAAGAAALADGRLSRETEAVLFLRYNYARYRLGRLVEARGMPSSAAEAREMVRWYGRQMQARAELVQANLPLVTAMARRATVPYAEMGDLISEGSLALLRSVERFDVSRGFKFSTYACRAILKSFHRLAHRMGRYRRQFPVEFDPDFEQGDLLTDRRERHWRDAIEDVREVLARNLARLTDLEQRILWERFFAVGRGGKRTLAEIAGTVGFSTERVRQIQHRALRKIRAALEDRDPCRQEGTCQGPLRKGA